VILADTSVWIGHLRGDESRLAPLLEGGRVLMHPAVLGAMVRLPRAVTATDAEALALVESHALHGQGIGWVDVHLLAATLLTPGARLWSADRRLAALAARAGVAPSNTG
jgi:predicted nucleic acid-binding protein